MVYCRRFRGVGRRPGGLGCRGRMLRIVVMGEVGRVEWVLGRYSMSHIRTCHGGYLPRQIYPLV